MKGILELLKESFEGEGLSEVKRENLYDRILAKIELHELLHAEQLFLHLRGGEVIVQEQELNWIWGSGYEIHIPNSHSLSFSGPQHELLITSL